MAPGACLCSAAGLGPAELAGCRDPRCGPADRACRAATVDQWSMQGCWPRGRDISARCPATPFGPGLSCVTAGLFPPPAYARPSAEAEGEELFGRRFNGARDLLRPFGPDGQLLCGGGLPVHGGRPAVSGARPSGPWVGPRSCRLASGPSRCLLRTVCVVVGSYSAPRATPLGPALPGHLPDLLVQLQVPPGYRGPGHFQSVPPRTAGQLSPEVAVREQPHYGPY